MARKLTLFLLWLLCLPGLALAQNTPIEIRLKSPGTCPGCDCPADYCFSPVCDCTLPVTDVWARGMLERIERVLVLAYPNLKVHTPLEIHALSRFEMGQTKGEPNYGLYGPGFIRLSREVSRREAVAIIGHEYGHAWHFENHPDPDHMSDVFVEGFAEWVAYQAVKRLGDTATAERLKRNPDPVYGGGFRWFLQLERERGLPVMWEVALGWLDMKGNRVSQQSVPGGTATPPSAPANDPNPDEEP